jgi:hypothetical protein
MKKANAELVKKEKGLARSKQSLIKIGAVALSVIVIIVTFIALQRADRAAKDTVAVVRVRNGTPAFSIITKDNVEKYDLVKKEYIKEEMFLYENVDDLYGQFTAYYIRGKTILYRDQLLSEKPIRNEWLYVLSEEEEVVTIPYKSSEAGGDILLPGDMIRIRATYETELGVQGSQSINSKKSMKTETLFDSIIVKDMLNSSGRSVYEIYKDLMRLDDKDRETTMKKSEFQSSIKPASLLLAGSSEDMERYALFKSMVSNGDFLITILSRTPSSELEEMLTLETEVRSWINGT